jgi:hypothetical protein
MDRTSNTSASRDVPIAKPKQTYNERYPAPEVRYNAGLDQFVSHSPPTDVKETYNAVHGFLDKISDWLDPEGAKKRR